MFNNDIESILAVSNMDLYDLSSRVSPYKVNEWLDEQLKKYMWYANCRHIGLGREIPVGFDFTVSVDAVNRGSGFFNAYSKVSLNIPYVRVATGYGTSEDEQKVYKDYELSVFNYKIFWGKSFHEVNEDLSEMLKRFSDAVKERRTRIYRPIGFRVQQVGAYRPAPALEGFQSYYEYLGILLYEEIFEDRGCFLIGTKQVQNHGTLENQLWKWGDGRVIGENLDEGLKNFPEEEGIEFCKDMAIMYSGLDLGKYSSWK